MPDFAPLTKLTGIWQKTSSKGVAYVTGRLGAAKLVILPNQDKQTDTDADLIVYVQEPSVPQRTTTPAETEERGWDGITPDPGEPERRRPYQPEREF
jgi:hypothetical protein